MIESTSLQSLTNAVPESPAGTSRGSESDGFGKTLRGAIASANADQVSAESEAKALAEGEGDIVDTMIAISRAELSMQFVVSLRNRALDAYQTIMRLQV